MKIVIHHLFLILISACTHAFQQSSIGKYRSMTLTLGARKTLTKERIFDPIGLTEREDFPAVDQGTRFPAVLAGASALTALAPEADAVSRSLINTGDMDPTKFNPVCPASDGLYRFLQGSTATVIGDDAFVEYGPLIAGGLLRIRLELCVVESFWQEAVVPFIARNGLSWVLPLHETVETFIAGVIFALASTFILIGSTKIVSVIAFYADFFVGGPFRTLGGFTYDRAMGRPITFDIGIGSFKTRIIGPPEEEVMKPRKLVGPLALILATISGGARIVGVILGVSESTSA